MKRTPTDGASRRKRLETEKDRTRALESAWVGWVQRHSVFVFLSLVLLASLRIIATYHVYDETADEPAHIACGMEWLAKGTFQYEPKHPPLARVAAAIGPYLAGARPHGVPEWWLEGLAILSRDHHERNLTFARLGILPFFWLSCFVVYVWSRRFLGEPGAAFAVLFYTFLPGILAHSGLATNDMAVAALIGASFLSGVSWAAQPNWANTVMFGAATGLAVLAKFTAFAFIPVAFVAAIGWFLLTGRSRPIIVRKIFATHFVSFCVAVLCGAITIWAGYRFSVGHVDSLGLSLPAPELFTGIQQAMGHEETGHASYLLGELSLFGWWYYYIVALAVKTPLPLAGLILCGVFLRKNKDTREENFRIGLGLAYAFACGILFLSFFNTINIGIRHILPVYIGFSIAAAAGAVRLLAKAHKSRAAAWALGVLVLWLISTSALAHPDYLPYFNALAGGEPERILADSDLDWGQDLKRVAKRLHDAGAKEVSFQPFLQVDFDAIGLPPIRKPDPLQPTPGWHAVSLTELKVERFGLYQERMDLKLWPEKIKPTEKIGRGMWLFYFPPDAIPRLQ